MRTWYPKQYIKDEHGYMFENRKIGQCPICFAEKGIVETGAGLGTYDALTRCTTDRSYCRNCKAEIIVGVNGYFLMNPNEVKLC